MTSFLHRKNDEMLDERQPICFKCEWSDCRDGGLGAAWRRVVFPTVLEVLCEIVDEFVN